MMSSVQAPTTPGEDRRDRLLATLGELIARGGERPLLAPPVVPGPGSFPEPWRPTLGGVTTLLRRLAWHAETDRVITVTDARLGAPPTERKPETRVELTTVSARELRFRLEFLGEDDIAGTLAHELGVAHAVANPATAPDPYRVAQGPSIEVDADRDLARGSVATVYLGLGVLAANAAFQQYSRAGRFNGGYSPLEYDVLRAGYLPMSELAYLLAVQAVVRGAGAPHGLSPPQRDEVAAWLAVLRPEASALRERLGIPAAVLATGGRSARATPRRAPVVPFDDVDVEADAPAPRTAFRWRTHRGGVGFIAGAALGMGLAIALATPGGAPWIVVGGAAGGHVLGRRVRVPRCSSCASVLAPVANTCAHCGATIRGEIERLSDRLEAEELLEDPRDRDA